MARLSAQSVSTIISVYHLFVFLRFSPDEKLFRHREPQRAEEEMENTECRSVYDKISNRLERRQRKTGRRHKIGGFPFRVLSVWNYWQQEPFAIYTCLYICAKCVSMDTAQSRNYLLTNSAIESNRPTASKSKSTHRRSSLFS